MTFHSCAELAQGRTSPLAGAKTIPIQGWNCTGPVFAGLIAEAKPKIIIEVGTWLGASAFTMAKAAPEARLYCMDTWLGNIDHYFHASDPVNDLFPVNGYPSIYYKFLDNMVATGMAGRIFPVPNTSLTGSRLLARAGIFAELIYIDASHEYDDVYADLCAYRSLLAPGGILFGDDFRDFPGVTHAVLRFKYEYNLDLKVDGPTWILREK